MRQWEHHDIVQMDDIVQMQSMFRSQSPYLGAIDTETSGLDIIDDRPFLLQFGWLNRDGTGHTFICDIEFNPAIAQMALHTWQELCVSLDWYTGANIKYDLHMITNWNPSLLYTGKNLTELQAWIRMGHDNIPTRFGGVPLALKDYAAMFIDKHARDHEKLLRQERTAIAGQYNAELVKALGMKKGVLNEFFKDPLNEPEDLPNPEQVEAYYTWYRSLPDRLRQNVIGCVEADNIPYNMLNRSTVCVYGHFDIVYTLEALTNLVPVVTARENLKGIELENDCIMPFYEMERVGFDLDLAYLGQCKLRMKDYILRKRERLYEIAGESITCGQHAKIKEIINRTALCKATGAEELEQLTDRLKQNDAENPAIEFIELIQELRTLEKWYTTYLLRFTRAGKKKAYTQISQVGAASGRVTSDFQQFPKEAILDDEGNELFHPRRMVLVDAPVYPEIVYLDWSQIELRVQAFYTLLLGAPDFNLCRAYFPHQCYDALDGTEYAHTNPEHVKSWNKGTWLTLESNEPWQPIDVHGAMTKIAFKMDESHPDFKHNRSMGKRVNFAKNYGAGFFRIKAMFPHLSDELIHAIDDAYYIAFPGVKKYHDYCMAIAVSSPYAVNMFGVKYYNVSGHNLRNMLVQGTSAYLLKMMIVEINRFLKEQGAKSQMQMNIHDEVSFKRHRSDPIDLFYRIKEIMEDWGDSWVPIVAEMEVTSTTWAEKKAPSTSWA